MFLEAHSTDEETKAQSSDHPESPGQDSASSPCVSEIPFLLESVARAPDTAFSLHLYRGAHSAFVTRPEDWALGPGRAGSTVGSLAVGSGGSTVISALWNFLAGITGGCCTCQDLVEPGDGRGGMPVIKHSPRQQATLGQ